MTMGARPAASQVVGTAPGSSCAGFPTGSSRVTQDADYDGKDVVLICEGGTWNPAGSSLGGSPGGSNTNVQFNSSGAFGGSANMIWDGTTFAVSHSAASATAAIGGTTTSTTAGAAGLKGAASNATGTSYGVYGKNTSTTGDGYGVYGTSTSSSGFAVGGVNSAGGIGVVGQSDISAGVGIEGITNSATGTAFKALVGASSGSPKGVYINASTTGGYGVYQSGGQQNYFSGSFGIGTVSPNAKLHVRRSAGAGSTADMMMDDGTQSLWFNSNESGSSYNSLVQLGDHAIHYTNGSIDTGGLVIGPWSASAKGIRIDSAGNVGIGITPPSYKLDVSGGSIRATGTADWENGFYSTSKNGNTATLRVATAGTYTATEAGFTGTDSNIPFIIRTNGSPVATFLTSGNVGIGETNPASKLTIKADGGTQLLIAGATNTNNQLLIGFDTTSNYGFIQPVTQFVAYRNLALNASGGNVGIGTTAPSAQLHVHNPIHGGDIGIGQQNDATAYMRLGMDTSWVQYEANNAYWTGSAYNYVNTTGYSGTATRIAQGGGTLYFETASGGTNPISWQTRMLLANNGNVGIGTTNPGTALEVDGSASLGFLRLRNSGAAAGKYWGFGPDVNNNNVIYNQSSTGVWIADGGTAWIANSDRRLKANIEPLKKDMGLAAIEKLNPVTYNWKDAEQNREAGERLGLIAQDVKAVFPQLVAAHASSKIKHADGRVEEIKDVLGLDYAGLVVPLVKAVQELKHGFDGMVADVRTLAARVDQASIKLAARDRDMDALREDDKELHEENAALRSAVCGLNSEAPFCHGRPFADTPR
jgi:hypothetical protein